MLIIVLFDLFTTTINIVNNTTVACIEYIGCGSTETYV